MGDDERVGSVPAVEATDALPHSRSTDRLTSVSASGSDSGENAMTPFNRTD